jgi:hypothetical protein
VNHAKGNAKCWLAPLVAAVLLMAAFALAEPAGAVVNGCFVATAYQRPTAFFGNVIGTGRTIGQWCTLGAVGNAKRLDGWAETSTPGWRASGLQGSNAGVVSGEGRSWSKYTLTLGSGGWNVQQQVLCPRVRGTANATYYQDVSCTIW